MNGSRPWIAGVLLGLVVLATSSANTASAQIVIGGGGWSGPGGGWNSWGISAGVGTGVGAWGMPMPGPRYGPGWARPYPAVSPSFGHCHRPRMVVPPPVIVRPIIVPPHHGHHHGHHDYYGW